MAHLGRAKDCVLTGGLSHSMFGLTHAWKAKTKGLGFLLMDNLSQTFLLNTGMKEQCGHWLNPVLSSATHFKHRQGKLLTSLPEKASRQLFLLFIRIQLSSAPYIYFVHIAIVVLCINLVRIHPLLQDLNHLYNVMVYM